MAAQFALPARAAKASRRSAVQPKAVAGLVEVAQLAGVQEEAGFIWGVAGVMCAMTLIVSPGLQVRVCADGGNAGAPTRPELAAGAARSELWAAAAKQQQAISTSCRWAQRRAAGSITAAAAALQPLGRDECRRRRPARAR